MVVAVRDTRSSLGVAVAPIVGVGSGLAAWGSPPSWDRKSPAGDGGAYRHPAPTSVIKAGCGGAAVTGGGGAADGRSPSQRPRRRRRRALPVSAHPEPPPLHV